MLHARRQHSANGNLPPVRLLYESNVHPASSQAEEWILLELRRPQLQVIAPLIARLNVGLQLNRVSRPILAHMHFITHSSKSRGEQL